MGATPGRVGLITPRYAPRVGGVELYTEMLARGLAERGVGVEVLTSDASGRLPRLEEMDRVVVRRFATMGGDGVYDLSPGLIAWLARNSGQYEVLHVNNYHSLMPPFAAAFSRRERVPFVFSTHYHGKSASRLRRGLLVPVRLPCSWAVSQAQALICNSRAERENLCRHFGPHLPAEVIHPGLEVEGIQSARPLSEWSGHPIVLAVGRLEAYKQVDKLVAAAAVLPRDFEVVVVGDGPARRGLEQAAASLVGSARVHLLGRVPREELLSWYATAHVFVALSRQESFGLALLEGAVSGAAVVASDISAHHEVAVYGAPGQVAFVGVECTPDELASAVLEACHRGRISHGERSQRFPTWLSLADRTLEVYALARERRERRALSRSAA
jgi:glycogen synthase